jgi:serine/threonine protein phosphatase PrpC
MRPPDQSPFAPHLDAAARSAIGVGALMREENQDNFLLIDATGNASFLREQQPQHVRLPDWPAGHARVAVLDGMGGHGHGREAAEAVVAGLLALPPCTAQAELAAGLAALHARLQCQFAEAERTGLRPGTTLTLLELPPSQDPLLYHVGDSRLYEIDGTHATPLTIDHVPATGLAMYGQMGERAWRRQVHGQHSAQITQAFILGNSFANPARLDDDLFELTPLKLPPWLRHLPDRRTVQLRPDCVYLLATDGFWSCADPESWLARWPKLLVDRASAAEAVDALFAEINQHPPMGLVPDNLTAVVLRVV